MPYMISLLLAGWLASAAAQAQSRIAVFKCTGADGKLSYQQKPCPPRSEAATVTVDGDIDPELARQARERAAANAPPPREQPDPDAATRLTDARSQQAPPVRCPATRENPGIINVVGTDPWSMAIARSMYDELPSETWLKNTGRWPKGCVY